METLCGITVRQKKKRALENKQVEATRLTTDGNKLCSIQRLYDDTKWETLQKRRIKHKLYRR